MTASALRPHSEGQAPQRLAPAEEQRLVARLLERDRKAAAEFVERYSDSLYRYLRARLTPRVELADDLLQEVFLSAFRALPQFRGESGLRSWLMGIARHKVEDHYRERLREAEPLENTSELPFVLTDEERLDREGLQARIRRTLAELPSLYSAALLWRYWEKRTAREIAEATGRTEKAVERLLARSREAFRRRWKDA